MKTQIELLREIENHLREAEVFLEEITEDPEAQGNAIEVEISKIRALKQSLIDQIDQGGKCVPGEQHPIQPLVKVEGVVRFKENKIVRFLLDYSAGKGVDLNDLHRMKFSVEDHVQLAQLMGYSVSGFGELSYVPADVVQKADTAAEELYD